MATSASTGSSHSSTAIIPADSSAAWVIWPSDCANRSPIALTSLVTRVSRSPFWRRWWKPSESRWSWS